MTRDEFARYAKNGFVLVEHTERKDKEGDALKDYIKPERVPTYLELGWRVAENVAITPPEALEVPIEVLEQPIAPTKGRPKNV